jgi:hypothetical protein
MGRASAGRPRYPEPPELARLYAKASRINHKLSMLIFKVGRRFDVEVLTLYVFTK